MFFELVSSDPTLHIWYSFEKFFPHGYDMEMSWLANCQSLMLENTYWLLIKKKEGGIAST